MFGTSRPGGLGYSASISPRCRSRSRPRRCLNSPTSRRPAGIHFRHTNGAFGKKYLPETLGSGVAFLDADNDGWQDILFVNGRNWPGQARGRVVSSALPQQRQRHVHGHHARRWSGRRDVRHGRERRPTTTTTATRDIYITALGPNHLVQEQRRRTSSRTSRRAPVSAIRGSRRARCGSITIATGSSICSSATTSSGPRTRISSAR